MQRSAPARDFTVAAILLVMLLAGCAAPWPAPQPTPDPKAPDAQQIVRPQEISDAVQYQNPALEVLDPALIYLPSDYDNAQLLFPPLVTLDENQRPTDWAAARHDISADGLTYTFHLRTGMTWSDGAPLDANTFAYSINRALDPCTWSYNARSLAIIKGAQAFTSSRCPLGALHSPTTLIGASLLVPDPLTLQILLERPAGYFLSALTCPLSWAVPQWLVERYTQPATQLATVRDGQETGFPPPGTVVTPQEEGSAEEGLAVDADVGRGQGSTPQMLPDWLLRQRDQRVIASGLPHTTSTWTAHLTDNGGLGGNLYRLTTWDHVGHLAFERNERFWGKKPVVRRIDRLLYATPTDAWKDFVAGKGDIGTVPFLDASGNNGAAVARTLPGVTVQQTPVLETVYLTPDWQRPPFDDLRVRQAVSLAIDRQALARVAVEPLFPLASQVAVIPSVHLVPEGMPGYNPGLADVAGRTGKEALTPDVPKARALATAYAAERCGRAFSGCPPLVVWGSDVDRGDKLLAWDTLLEEEWQTAFPGWPSTFCNVEGRCHPIPRSPVGRGQLTVDGWFADYPDPQNVLSLAWTTQAQYNQSSVSIPAVDALCAQADASTDQDARLKGYQQAEQMLVTQVAAIPLYQYSATSVVRSRVVGWRLAPTGQTPLSVWQRMYIRR
jgi:ABC-type oligopeptide transport system substrate-binding subunit